jgi:L-asparagine transporter-like permease
VNGFGKIEGFLGVIKTATNCMFILVAGFLIIKDWMNDVEVVTSLEKDKDFFTEGAAGFWGSLIYAFYAFGGVEVMGLLGICLKDHKKLYVQAE